MDHLSRAPVPENIIFSSEIGANQFRVDTGVPWGLGHFAQQLIRKQRNRMITKRRSDT